MEELTWVRIIDPVHIPDKYIEQIKDRDFPVEKFKKYQQMACVEIKEGQLVINPYNLLFVLVEKEKQVKGFAWFVVDALCNALVINSFSMDNEYWGNGKCIKLLEDKAREIKDGAKLDKVYWITRCPKHSEKFGFKRSKHILMEYKGYGQDNDGIRCEANGESGSDDPGGNAVP